MDTHAEAMATLSRLPGAAAQLDLIVAASKSESNSFKTGLDALVRLTAGREDRVPRLEAYVAPCLEKHPGFMTDVFLTALAFDLGGLRAAIQEHATESPEVVDGDGANYSGGNFKGPAGQHYHAGREVLALWAEEDPATAGRMWLALAAARTYQFDLRSNDDVTGRALRDKAAAAIARLPEDERRKHLDGILAALPGDTERQAARAVLEPLAGFAKAE